MANFRKIKWKNVTQLPSWGYTCWDCGKDVASDKGYVACSTHGVTEYTVCSVYICPHCAAPVIYDRDNVDYPNKVPGMKMDGKLPDSVEKVYDEARACMGAGAYTAAVMLFRKILMNIAVEEGAKPNLKFIEYINYLRDNMIIHKRQHKLADEIRTLGNDANHEIESRTKEDADKLFGLVRLILTYNYVFAD